MNSSETASSSKARTILVTGANGFVGQAVCKKLSSAEFSVRALLRGEPPASWSDSGDSASKSENNNAANLKLEIFKGDLAISDLANTGFLEQACAGCSAVVHLAGIAHVNADPGLIRDSNVTGTANLLQAAIGQQVPRFVLLSSSLAAEIDQADADTSDYAGSKKAAEQLLLNAANENKIEAVILRPVNIYGAGMRGNLARMIELIATGRLPPLPRLTNRISLVGVNDVANVIALALNQAAANGRTYELTDGEQYTIADIEQAVYAAVGRKMPGWRIPRMLLYAAAASAGLWNGLIGSKASKTGGISLRTYHNLLADNLFANDASCTELGFEPSTTLYQELPDIVRAITTGRTEQ